jgi:6-phosphogluconate dehydrogenase
MRNSTLGIIGLGVMGQMLALNFERNGLRVAGYDLDPQKSDTFSDSTKKKNVVVNRTLESFMAELQPPRRILIMVPAGPAVEEVIREIKPYLKLEDILMDGGNSHFHDTERRYNELDNKICRYLGLGISGGEAGALWGPSIMAGGSNTGWQTMQPVLLTIAAKVDGEACAAYLGPGGAGHYIKMVHNGIEYGLMQLIAEVYDLLRWSMPAKEIQRVFDNWNQGKLESYLLRVARDVIGAVDTETQKPLVEVILDVAEQKGTGQWTTQNAFDLGVAIPTINAAVEARNISSRNYERNKYKNLVHKIEMNLSKKFLPSPSLNDLPPGMIESIENALYTAALCTFTQGFQLLKAGSQEYGYTFDFYDIARIWRGGCIIQGRIINEITEAFAAENTLDYVLLAHNISQNLVVDQVSLRQVVKLAVDQGLPIPAFSASLAYFDSIRTSTLPANLTQGMRDYFGGHSYQRIDKAGKFHTIWHSDHKSSE